MIYLLRAAQEAIRNGEWQRAVDLAAVAAADPNHAIRARALYLAAWVERHRLHRSEAIYRAADAVLAAEEAGDRSLLKMVLRGAAAVAAHSGCHAECLEWAGRLFCLEPTREERLHAHLTMAWSLYTQEDLGSAWIHAEEARAQADPGMADWGHAHAVAALVACARGLPRQALRLIAAAQPLVPPDQYDTLAELVLARTRAHLLLQNASEARAAMATAVTLMALGRDPAHRVEFLTLRSWTLARDGRIEEARRHGLAASQEADHLERPDLGVLVRRTLTYIEDVLDL
ncbi:MAG: hypothetical protein DIU70_010915 [Bacillota bacterium]|nr:MAG: hypothetical protein DIU70_10260 [Bacillota bacterium]